MLLFYNKTLLSLKSKEFGFISQSEIDNIIACYVKLGELLNFIFEIYSNNIFLKLSILFFEKIHKSFLKIKSSKAKQLVSALLYESMVRFTEIITSKKIEFIDKFKDSKINYKLIKTLNKILDFITISLLGKNKINNNDNNNSKKFVLGLFPNIPDIFNYLLISRTNIFSLNAYFLFDDFSKAFYQIIKKLISALRDLAILPEKYEEVKTMLNINLFKLLEILRIKDDLKNSIEDSQHEFYLDSLNLYIKITKLVIKNFYTVEILADDGIKDKICRFLIELSFWDSLDVVDNSCKFFLLIWKIAEKHKVFMRSEIEKIVDFLFLRRFKLFISQIEPNRDTGEDSLVKLSVLEVLVNYLVILVRDYNFVFLVYLNFDFCKIRFNLLSEILVSCQKYFELSSLPIYSHLKSVITTLYLSIFEILHDVIVNGNFAENAVNHNNKRKEYYAALNNYDEDEKGLFNIDSGYLNKKEKEEISNNNNNINIHREIENEKNCQNSNQVSNSYSSNNNNKNTNTNKNNAKEIKHTKKTKNKHCVNKKLKNTFASDLEESEVERNKNENSNNAMKTAAAAVKNKDFNPDNVNNPSTFSYAKNHHLCSESSEIEEEDNDYDVAEQPQNLNNNDSESNEISHNAQNKKEEIALPSKFILDQNQINNSNNVFSQNKNQINDNINKQIPSNNTIDASSETNINNYHSSNNTNANTNNNNAASKNKIQICEKEPYSKFNIDFNFIKEIQHLQDLWNDEVLGLVNLPSFKKFNNKICPLFGLSPIETVHKKKKGGKKAAAAAEKESVLETKETTTENTGNSVSSLASSNDNESSYANNDAANSSFASNNSNNSNILSIINIDNVDAVEFVNNNKAAEAVLDAGAAFEIINTENEEKILFCSTTSLSSTNNIFATESINNPAINVGNYTNINDINSNNNNKPEDVIVSLKAQDALLAANYRKFAYSIAMMLKYSFYVDIEKLHEIFGNKNDLSKLILEEYLNTFDFRGLDILKAYRIYVSTFKLTGESDNIYNMIMAFSEKYHQDNPNDSNLRSSDEVSTLAYSILMLNTELHDPNIKEHMSLEEFVKNVYSTRYFDHIAKTYLENIYKSISSHPFKVPCKRNDDYNKSEELFDVLKSKRNMVKNRKVFFESAKKKHLKSIYEKEQKARESSSSGNATADKAANKRKEEEEEEVDANDDISKNLVQNYQSEVFLSDYDFENSQKFLMEMLNFEEDKAKSQQQSESDKAAFNKLNCFEIPKIKRSLNFSLFNLCENFNSAIDFKNCRYSDAGIYTNTNNGNSETAVISQEAQNKVLSAVYYLLWEDVYYNFMEISSKFYERKDENVNKIFDKICVIAEKLNKKDYIHKLIVKTFF